MKKIYKRFLRELRKTFRVAIIIFFTSLLVPVINLLSESFINPWIDKIKDFILSTAPLLIIHPWFIPFIVFTLWLGVSALKSWQEENWNEVDFSPWMPVINHEILGGVKIHNGKNVDLKNCTAEFINYEDDTAKALGLSNISDQLTGDIIPDRLYWHEIGNKPQIATTIGRDKDAWLALVFPSKDDAKVVGKELIYKIRTEGAQFIHPVENGYLYVSVSAQVNDKPLAPKLISVRIELEGKTVFIREVIDYQEKKNEVAANANH